MYDLSGSGYYILKLGSEKLKITKIGESFCLSGDTVNRIALDFTSSIGNGELSIEYYDYVVTEDRLIFNTIQNKIVELTYIN